MEKLIHGFATSTPNFCFLKIKIHQSEAINKLNNFSRNNCNYNKLTVYLLRKIDKVKNASKHILSKKF